MARARRVDRTNTSIPTSPFPRARRLPAAPLPGRSRSSGSTKATAPCDRETGSSCRRTRTNGSSTTWPRIASSATILRRAGPMLSGLSRLNGTHGQNELTWIPGPARAGCRGATTRGRVVDQATPASIIPLERATHMRRSFILAILFASALHLHGMAQPSGWTTLLDGTTLKGWIVVGDANWAAVDGAVQATKGGTSYLVTPNTYADFQLVAEVWVSAGANSGIFVRCQDPKNITAANCVRGQHLRHASGSDVSHGQHRGRRQADRRRQRGRPLDDRGHHHAGDEADRGDERHHDGRRRA